MRRVPLVHRLYHKKLARLTNENSESASVSEREWSLEPETTTSTNPVAQKQQETQLAQQEERRMKVVLQEKQEDLYNATQNDNGPSYAPLVKVCWGIASVLLILLICHVSIKILNINNRLATIVRGRMFQIFFSMAQQKRW